MAAQTPAAESRYISAESLSAALTALFGTADHLIKIWFALKQMGMTDSHPVEIDTGNSTPALKRLFSFGHPDKDFYLPFAHTERYLTMKGDASRSIVQTTLRRWYTSDSVVTCNPSDYLTITESGDGKLLVRPGRRYPVGLGNGKNGFALDDGKRVSIPAIAFAVWYGRQTPIPAAVDPVNFLIEDMRKSLHLTQAEFGSVFVDAPLKVVPTGKPLADKEIFAACSKFLKALPEEGNVYEETFIAHTERLRTMVVADGRPKWLSAPPEELLKRVLASGAKAVLLYGPPRTGKTRAIDNLIARNDAQRETIQIHPGWGYDQLVEGFRPDPDGKWDWVTGPLKLAIDSKKKYIVLEEVNRIALTESLGEVFSLIEESYRGDAAKIRLRSGKFLSISPDTTFLMTMNTIDKSTEDLDDALFGRFSSVEFPPRTEDLADMLRNSGVEPPTVDKILSLFTEILPSYQLGHGYFSSFKNGFNPIEYYVTKIRPVLANHFQAYKPDVIAQIDNKVDSLFES